MKQLLGPTKKKIIETVIVFLIYWVIGEVYKYLFPSLLGPGFYLGESDSERFQRLLSETLASISIASIFFLLLYLLVAYIGTKTKKSYLVIIIVVAILLFVTYVMPFLARLIWLNYYNFNAFPNR